MTAAEVERRIRELREDAARARRWVRGLSNPEVVDRLAMTAQELDREADALEATLRAAGPPASHATAPIQHAQVQVQQQKDTKEDTADSAGKTGKAD